MQSAAALCLWVLDDGHQGAQRKKGVGGPSDTYYLLPQWASQCIIGMIWVDLTSQNGHQRDARKNGKQGIWKLGTHLSNGAHLFFWEKMMINHWIWVGLLYQRLACFYQLTAGKEPCFRRVNSWGVRDPALNWMFFHRSVLQRGMKIPGC